MANTHQTDNNSKDQTRENKKLPTKIYGLDKLFHGGLHLEETRDEDEQQKPDQNKAKQKKPSHKKPSSKNLIIVIRGEHGTNKIHLAMQMCEGLHKSAQEQGMKQGKMLFISLNKDEKKVKELYYDFYVKRLILNIQSKAEGWEVACDKINEIIVNKRKGEKNLMNYIMSLFGETETTDSFDKEFIHKAFATGVLYYNTRTHGIHIRQQKRNDDSDETQLFNINYDYQSLSNVTFWGRNELNDGEKMAGNRSVFFKLIQKLEEIDKYYCIMIDGLSILSSEESEDCPLNMMASLMRNKCTIGVVTTSDTLPASKIDSDIVIDLRIRTDAPADHMKKELCIYKCLYQKNIYGWHQYKMRNAGVEVIPSLHKTLSLRNYMDESIPEALLSLDDVSYSYWLTENEGTEDKISSGETTIKKLEGCFGQFRNLGNKNKYESINQGKLVSVISNKETELKELEDTVKQIKKEDHILFIDLKRNRKDFWDLIQKSPILQKEIESRKNRCHFFGFRAGCIYADEFLYVIEQQVEAIARSIKQKENKDLYQYFKQIHIIMGDLNMIQYRFPCLQNEKLFLPAFAALTKANHMTNYIYLMPEESEANKKLRLQLSAIADEIK